MKKIIIIIFVLLYSNIALSKVEICSRPAEMAFGIVDHQWLKTDKLQAGMGSDIFNRKIQIGDHFEAPFITEVFIIDHSGQTNASCAEETDVDEECVNEELEIGKPLVQLGVSPATLLV